MIEAYGSRIHTLRKERRFSLDRLAELYDEELTADQVAYLHERAAERRKRWKEHDTNEIPPLRPQALRPDR